MSEPMDWQTADGHPPASLLLLYFEHELANDERKAVERHLHDCWVCRAQWERLEQGMYVFLEYRETLPPVMSPSPQSRDRFLCKVHEAAVVGSLRSSVGRILRGSERLRALCLVGGVRHVAVVAALLALLLVGLPLGQPPVRGAAEFLHQVRSATRSELHSPQPAAPRKVELRHGAKVVKREVRWGEVRLARQVDPPPAELTSTLQLVRMDWRDPLNADNFAVWRDTLAHKEDRLYASGGFLTLKTSPLDEGPVLYAELTVRRADWHPVAEHVEFRDRPALKVTESTVGMPPVLATVPVAQPDPVAVKPAAAPLVAYNNTPIVEALRPSGPSRMQLAEAEVRLWESLHRVAADIHEAPVIRRGKEHIYYQALVQTPERKQEILVATNQIPYLRPEFFVAAKPAASEAQSPDELEETSVYTIKPPLAQALAKHLGGLDRMNRFLIQLREIHLQMLVESTALERLAKRYAGGEWENLTPDSRQRLNRVAADHVARMRSQSKEYSELILPVLEEMMRRQKVPAPATAVSGTECLSWREQAAPVVEELQRLQTSFRRLFVAEQTDAPVTVSAVSLLQESAAAYVRLQGHLARFCASEP